MASPRFLDYFRRKLSWHYLQGIGESFFSAFADELDGAVIATKDAVKQRILPLAKDEALPYIGQTFNLDYPARFTPDAARAYIDNPWTHWDTAGSAGRMILEVQALGYANVNVVSYRSLVDITGEPPLTTFGGFSSFWFLRIRPPFPFAWDVAGKWGPPPVGSGALWGSAPFLWGLSGAEVWQIDEIRRVIKKWKPAGSSCRFIEVWLRVSLFGLPTEVRRFPVHEDWEFDTNGAARDFYNSRYDKETA